MSYDEVLVEKAADDMNYCVCVFEDTEDGTACVINGFCSLDDQDMFVKNATKHPDFERYYLAKTLGNVRDIYNHCCDDLGEEMVDVMLCEGPVLPIDLAVN